MKNGEQKGETGTESLTQALETFAKIIVEDREEIHKRDLETRNEYEKQTLKLTTAIAISNVESRKDREFDTARMDRYEKVQDNLTESLRTLSDNAILLTEGMQSLTKRTDREDRIKSMIYTTIVIAFILAILGFNNIKSQLISAPAKQTQDSKSASQN